MADDKLPLELVGWKGFSTLKAYVNGECRMHYLRLLGVDVSQFGNIFVLIKLNFTLMKMIFLDVNKFKKENNEEKSKNQKKTFDGMIIFIFIHIFILML